MTAACGPEDTIAVFDPWPLYAALLDGELRLVRGVLQCDLGPVNEGEVEDVDERSEVGHRGGHDRKPTLLEGKLQAPRRRSAVGFIPGELTGESSSGPIRS